ncbi:hypothetical protein Bca4012_072252 [Brassica carinata]
MASYSGMVARTICEDSVLNHRSNPSQSSHQCGHVFAALMQSMCRWSNEINGLSRLVDPHVAATGFELLAVKREGILPMILRWFTARSCKDQCEGMDKASRKLSLDNNDLIRLLGKLILSIGKACLVKKQELYAMKFASIAEFGDESIEVLIFPRHISFAKIAQSLGSRRELLIGT